MLVAWCPHCYEVSGDGRYNTVTTHCDIGYLYCCTCNGWYAFHSPDSTDNSYCRLDTITNQEAQEWLLARGIVSPLDSFTERCLTNPNIAFATGAIMEFISHQREDGNEVKQPFKCWSVEGQSRSLSFLYEEHEVCCTECQRLLTINGPLNLDSQGGVHTYNSTHHLLTLGPNTGSDLSDIELVMSQCNVSPVVALNTLRKHKGDIVNAIIDLSS